MNIQPPVTMKFETISADKLAQAKAGICPHCWHPPEGRTAKTLETKHTCEAIKFLQCSRCLVVVALENT